MSTVQSRSDESRVNINTFDVGQVHNRCTIDDHAIYIFYFLAGNDWVRYVYGDIE